jgi:hypothetical protein
VSIATERRRALRFKLKLPLIVRWRNNSRVYEAVTVSKNVCSRGIYFCLGGERVKIGTFIEIILTLPQEITHSGNRKVRCLGRVERYELKDLEGSDAGVAMSIQKYEFLHNN